MSVGCSVLCLRNRKGSETMIVASSPIPLWQIEGETMETVSDFIFLGPKITADGDCCHEKDACSLEEKL